ncbi:hypothetical protein LNTAR_04416 [Lentisphaera araneosa HTCC2155]|uniref:Uncharacterized protein n=1 Tax=Lentisphaera araneosa HTCC2155 TaxID=313628 RepID=A6DQI2_9BACT|nr:hypothetical protein LNTAR_04416 [Lentisphaera araneosa HTCC2155]
MCTRKGTESSNLSLSATLLKKLKFLLQLFFAHKYKRHWLPTFNLSLSSLRLHHSFSTLNKKNGITAPPRDEH